MTETIPEPTADEIRHMPAGRALDKLVAEAIGVGWRGGNPIPGLDGKWPWPPPVSTDMAATELVLNAWHGDLQLRRQNGQWHCELFVPSMQWDAWGDTLPLSVCRARLIAKQSNDQ